MTSSSLHFVLAIVFAFVALVAAAPLQARDVFVPPVLYPREGTVWKAGNHHNVTWDTSDAPVNITNKIGQIFLRTNGLTDINNPLATGFSILDGRHVIQVPKVSAGSDYQIVLFGDSGNFSPFFTITN